MRRFQGLSLQGSAYLAEHVTLHECLMAWEEQMRTGFSKPLSMFIGLGFPREISDAADAFELLNDMPSHMRGPAHSAALNACRAAMRGEVDQEVARGLVRAYAKARGILPSRRLPKWQLGETKVF